MPDSDSTLNLGSFLILILLLIINGLTVAAEYAFVRVRRTRLDELIQRGTAGAASAKHITERLDRYIAATQLLITMSGVGLGYVGEPALSALLEPVIGSGLQALDESVRRTISAIVALLIVTSITVVVSELIPKNLAIQYTERAALMLGGPTRFIEVIFRPLIWLLNGAAAVTLRLLGVRDLRMEESSYSVEELKLLVEASEESGLIEEADRELVTAAFEFGDLTAREVMVPRTEMQAVDGDSPLADLIQLASEHSRSKYPVYENDLDHIVGIAHVKDLVRVQHDSRRTATIRGMMREALFVPDTIKLDKLLAQMRTTHQHLAIVLDEYGGTAGLVTLADLLEQIIGEIHDSFDVSTPEMQRLPDGSCLVEGLTQIEDVNERLGLKLTDDYYDTIAGFVLGRLGRMAKVGDGIDLEDGTRLKVEALDGLRIARITIQPPRPVSAAQVEDAGRSGPTGP
ncbi:MAG: HlyC/CorC family transporter [Anaerolineales bacterium]|nr:HlyC/CorC family transporter [Anaerolineales bacterium]